MSEARADATRIVQLLDMAGYKSDKDGSLHYDNQEVDRGEMCYFPAPFDFPAYLRFFRRVTTRKEGKARKATINEHLGTTLEIDLFPFGIKVFLRYDRPNVLKVIIEDGDGMNKVAEYVRE